MGVTGQLHTLPWKKEPLAPLDKTKCRGKDNIHCPLLAIKIIIYPVPSHYTDSANQNHVVKKIIIYL